MNTKDTMAISCILLATSMMGCRVDPTGLRAQPERPRSVKHVAGADTVQIVYVCGNIYRASSNRVTATNFSFHSGNPTQMQTGRIPAKLSGRAEGETFVTAYTSDTLRAAFFPVFPSGFTLIVGNGGAPACTPQRDTAWTVGGELSAFVDQTKIFAGPSSADSIYGYNALIGPISGMSRNAIAVALEPYRARVAMQLSSGAVLVRLDSSYASWSALMQALRTISADAAFAFASPIPRSSFEMQVLERKPIESGDFTRAKWTAQDASLWPYSFTRLPLAWSCENGQYGSATPLITFVEGMPLAAHADINGTLVKSSFISRSAPAAGQKALAIPSFNTQVEHSLAVAGMAVARSDNALGIPGIV